VHIQRLLEQAWAAVEIDVRGIKPLVSVRAGNAPTEFKRLLDFVAVRLNAFCDRPGRHARGRRRGTLRSFLSLWLLRRRLLLLAGRLCLLSWLCWWSSLAVSCRTERSCQDPDYRDGFHSAIPILFYVAHVRLTA
jgi:hypothetical protein